MTIKQSLWLYRPVLNARDLFSFAHSVGIKKMVPPEQLHVTLATVREPCDWTDLELHDDTIVVEAGLKTVQIFGWDIKALTFGHPEIKKRHEELVARFPQMDHPLLRPHVTLYRGGKMPRGDAYEGEIILGPERAKEFDADAGRVKHVKVSEVLDGCLLRA
jgi:hypothetical protein